MRQRKECVNSFGSGVRRKKNCFLMLCLVLGTRKAVWVIRSASLKVCRHLFEKNRLSHPSSAEHTHTGLRLIFVVYFFVDLPVPVFIISCRKREVGEEMELWETNLTVFKLVNRGGASGSDLEINFLVFFFFMLLESKQNFFLEIVFSLDLDVRVPQSLMLIYFTLMCPIFAHSTKKNVAIQNKSFNNSQQVSVLLRESIVISIVAKQKKGGK